MTNQPMQKIIFGSPGTGKSHMVKAKILPRLGIDEDKNPENVIKAVFHPEYTYGDFMGNYCLLRELDKLNIIFTRDTF